MLTPGWVERQFSPVLKQILFEAGVPALRETTNFSVLLDSRGARDIGLALLNPMEAGQTPQEDRS